MVEMDGMAEVDDGTADLLPTGATSGCDASSSPANSAAFRPQLGVRRSAEHSIMIFR